MRNIESTFFGTGHTKSTDTGDATIHGGKGANLISLSQINGSFIVPKGIIIHSHYNEGYLAQIAGSIGVRVDEQLNGKAFVRSSANCEDGENKSASGIFESVMFQKTKNQLIEALETVYLSAKSDGAKMYFPQVDVQMAVVVQELVEDPDFSGVIENNGKIILVNYNTGYGENTVSGLKTPNRIAINEKGESHTGQNLRIPEQIKGMLLLVLDEVKTHFKTNNADIEFAIKDNSIYLLQYRPLTAELNINSKGSICEIYPGTIDGGVCINANEYKSIKQIQDAIGTMRGKKVILCIPTGESKYDPLLSIIQGLIIGEGGDCTHMANKAREYKIPSLSGVKISKIKNKIAVDFNTKKFAAISGSENVIEPLYLDNQSAIDGHINLVSNYIFNEDIGLEGAREYMLSKCSELMSEAEVLFIKSIINSNRDRLKTETISYLENGFDSCQSNRVLSKFISNIIMVGGMMYEYKLLGINCEIIDIKSLFSINIDIPRDSKGELINLAKKYGRSLDFLFPGVTPSPNFTMSPNEYIEKTLDGSAINSVRHVGGVGGMRQDLDRNHATDFRTFIKLKIEEDKRYYPGIGVLYCLLNQANNEVPLLNSIGVDSKFFKFKNELAKIVHKIKDLKDDDYSNYSVLCSTMIPEINFSKTIPVSETVAVKKNLMKAFHSPQRELGDLLSIIESICDKKNVDSFEMNQTMEYLSEEVQAIKSFNSPLHLPWTDSLAFLSNGLMGVLKNDAGEYINRYGVGYNGRSLEIQEINTVDGLVSYKMIIYNGMSFSGPILNDSFITHNTNIWDNIKQNGFMKFAFEYLNNQND